MPYLPVTASINLWYCPIWKLANTIIEEAMILLFNGLSTFLASVNGIPIIFFTFPPYSGAPASEPNVNSASAAALSTANWLSFLYSLSFSHFCISKFSPVIFLKLLSNSGCHNTEAHKCSVAPPMLSKAQSANLL